MKVTRALLAGLLLAACDVSETASAQDAGDDFTDEMPEDLPAGNGCDASTGAGSEECEEIGSTGGIGAVPEDALELGCVASEDCDGAGACVAAYEDGVRGDFACQFACVPTLDESAWCRDDASCCEPGAVCTARGYCVLADGAEDSTTGGSGTGGSGGTGGTGG